MMKQLLIFVIAMFLTSCSGTNKTPIEEQMKTLNDKWMPELLFGNDIPTDSYNSSKIPQLEILTDEMKYRGNDGCNNFMGSIEQFDHTSLKFGIGAGTRMMCENMEIPDQFNQILPLVASYKIKEMKLHLFDESGKEVMRLKKF